MSFEDNFKSADNFTDKKNLVKVERELYLSKIKKYIQEDLEIYKLFANLKLKELQKVTELISLYPEGDRYIFMQYGIAEIIKSGRVISVEKWDKIIKLILLCPEKDRSNFMRYGIVEIIKSGREISVEEWDKIIELISLCPEEDRSNFMEYGIPEIIKSGREIKIEEWDKIIELISLCPEENRYIFMRYGIAEIIKSGREIEIEEWDKIIELISLCPEKDRYIFMQYGISEIIKSGREISVEEWDKIIELISLCPEEDRSIFMQYGITEIIKSGREIDIKECKKIIELISLCPEENRSNFMRYGIAEIIKSGREIDIKECKKIIYYIKYFKDHNAINFGNTENILELIKEIDILNENKDNFNFEEILNKLNNKIFKRLERDKNKKSQFYRPENIEKKMERNLVVYIRQGGHGEVEGIKTSAMVKLLNDYINSGRSPVFSNLTITSYTENIYPHYIHELGVDKEQYKYGKGEDFRKIIADDNSNTIFLTHSNVREVQNAAQIPIISQSVLQNPEKYSGTKEKDYIPLQIFIDQNDDESPMNHRAFANKDRSISLERTLIAIMFSVLHLENRLLGQENEKE